MKSKLTEKESKMKESKKLEPLLPEQMQIQSQQGQGRKSGLHEPNHYETFAEYVLSLIGFSVGFGSFWRFPYLVYRNGGGAYLIPYFIFMILIGIPMLHLETVSGQMHQISQPFIYARINPGLKMLGLTCVCICYHQLGYYNLIMAYCYRFIFSAFLDPLPFADESPLEKNYYFSREILHKSDSIYEFGSINPVLFFFYIFGIIACYFIVRKGVKTSAKVMKVTAIVPYIFFIILAMRGMALEGASQGLKYLLIPDFSKLLSINIWLEALVQVFYQMGVGFAVLVNLSSLNKQRSSITKGLYIIPASIVLCGVLCAMNVFLYLGHFCHIEGLAISDLKLSGPELSFNIFPKALSVLPWANFWIFIFFISMILLGIDSQFAGLEAIFCFVKDEANCHLRIHDEQGNMINKPKGTIKLFGRLVPQGKMKQSIIFSMLIFCPFLSSQAGIYYLGFFDHFFTMVSVTLSSCIEYYILVYLLPYAELQRYAYDQTKERAPEWVRRLIKGRIPMLILLANFCMALIKQTFSDEYTGSLYCIGWVLSLYPFFIAAIYYWAMRSDKWNLTFKEIETNCL